MNKIIAFVLSGWISGVAFGAETTHFAVDFRPQSVSPEATLAVEYSPDFANVEGEKTVRVLVNDEVWVDASASGKKLFAFGTSGFYRFAHQVLVNGTVVHEMSAFCSVGDEGWLLEYPNRTAVSAVITEEIVGIGQGVFADMWDLEEVRLPTTLRYIASSAFEDDYYLDNVVIPDSVETIGAKAFKNCTEMISLKFGSGLKSVVDSAFENCISLECVAFKEGLVSLGARAFASGIGSMRLKSVVLPASLTHIGDGAFDGCDYITGVTVPTHLKTMAELFPGSYEKIETVVIPEGVTKIVDGMFRGCRALKSIVIPNTVVTIGESAFEGCEALSEIGLPDSVVELGTAAFSGCSSLQTVGLSKNLIAIKYRTFEKCPMLDSLVVPASVRAIGGKIYSGGTVYSLERKAEWYSYGYNYETRNGVYGKWYYSDLASLAGIYFLGDAPEVQSDTYEGMPSELISYVVKGSKGWYLAGSPTLPPNGWPQSGNTRPITYWTPNRFDVLFDGNGGSPSTYYAEQITDTTYSLPKTNPMRSGYLFDGWWTEKAAGAQVTANSRVTATKEHTLYAHWKLLSDGIRVIFNPNGGTVDPAEMYYPAGVTYGTLPVPTRIGHRFLGWYTSQVGGTLVTEASAVHKENNELYAHWAPITYKVVYNACGGSGRMSDQTHTYNVPQTLLANQFTFAGRTFRGWANTAGGPVKYANGATVENLAELQDQIVTLYAVWSGASYAVRFDSNGGYGSMGNQTFLIGVSQPIAKCVFTRSGYRFAGWAKTYGGGVAYSDQQSVKDLSTVNGATVVLYAVWESDGGGGGGQVDPPAPSTMCKVTFDPLEGECTETNRMVKTGSKVGTLPEYIRTGYRFDGWYTAKVGGSKLLSSTLIKDDVTYYAHVSPITYKVRFVANGGKGTMADQTFAYDAPQRLTANKFTRDGKRFVCWYNRESAEIYNDGGWVENISETQDEVIVLSACWGGTPTTKTLNEEGYWSTQATVAHGDECAFLITGLTADSAVFSLDVWGEYTYEEDGEVWEDEIWPWCCFEFENDIGGWDKCAILTRKDWDWVPEDIESVRLEVVVDGFYDHKIPANNKFEYLKFALGLEWDVHLDPRGGDCEMLDWAVMNGKRLGALPVPVRDGFEFVGWFTAASGGSKVSEETAVAADMALYAHWRLEGTPVFVPGEKVECDTELKGYTVSGLPTGLVYNRTSGLITGAATKPGEYVVKFAKSGAETVEMTIVVTAVPKITVALEGVNSGSDTNGCKVTGANGYLVGARVPLAVTAPRGTAFMGWYRDGEPWPNAEEYRKTSLAYTMGKEDVALVAKFKKEVVTVGCDRLEYGTFTAGVACGFGSGVLLDEGAGITTESGVKSIAVNKLPTGMKFDARTHLLTGWPTKAGTYPVEIVVTANSGAVERKSVNLVVAALPAWTVGDFAGTVTCADGAHGTASMKVDAAGKVTNGKLLEHGSNWTFTADSFASTSVTRGLDQDYVVFATAKCGKAEREIELHVAGWVSEGYAENAAAAAGVFGDADVELWRNVWKDADAKGVLAGIAGKYTYFFADGTALPLDLTSVGALSGKANIRERDNASVSFATTVFASTNGVEAAFYVAPDAKKGYAEICERFVLVPESGEREPGVAHRNPGVIALPESWPGDTGMGSVSVTPKGGQVDAGKIVTVSATPDSKSVFVKWRYEVGGEVRSSELSKLTLEMDGEHDVFAYAIFRSKGSFKDPVVAVEDAERAKFAALELGVQFSAFVTVEDVENMKPVKWSAQYLPSGLKINAETGEISGVATAVNSKPVVITATSVANPQKKTTFTLDVGVGDGKPAALPETAVGTFAGFVTNGTDNVATFTFTSSDKGALSAKVVDASGTVSFSGSGFGKSEDGKLYVVDLKTTKGEKLLLTLDSGAGWDRDQLTGTYKAANGLARNVTSQRNAFSKAWYFAAEGDAANGWAFALTNDAKAAALTVTLKADGATSLAGKLPNGVDKNDKAVTIAVSASGVANAGMMTGGALAADFAPVLTVGGKKKVLSVRTNLWFDRRNSHPEGVGGARFVE